MERRLGALQKLISISINRSLSFYFSTFTKLSFPGEKKNLQRGAVKEKFDLIGQWCIFSSLISSSWNKNGVAEQAASSNTAPTKQELLKSSAFSLQIHPPIIWDITTALI